MRKHTREWLLWGALLGAVVFGPGLCYLARLSVVRWRLDRKLAVLSAEQAQLRQEQARLQSDPTYVEGRIRSPFKVAQPGEVVIPLDEHKRTP